MASPAHFQATRARIVQHVCRQTRHLFVRALILALVLQFFPFQPSMQGQVGELPQVASTLNLADISRVVGPQVAHAAIATLTKSGDTQVDQGENIYYTLSVQGDGDSTLSPKVYDIIDLTNVYTVLIGGTSGWLATRQDLVGRARVYFLTNTLGAGQTANLEIILIPQSPITDGAVITNDVYYATWDSGNITGTHVVTTVISAPAFSLGSASSDEPICAGTIATYTIYLTNTGHMQANPPFTVTVNLDDQAQFVSASDGGTESGGTVTWVFNTLTLLVGNSAMRTVAVRVPSTLTHQSILTHTVRATSPDVLPDGLLTVASTVQRVAADLAANTPVCTFDVVTFTQIYSDVAVAEGYWDWGDGTPGLNSVDAAVTHTYSSGGYYTVTHVVTGNCGSIAQTHSYTSVVFVDGITPSFEPTTTVSICVGSSVTFTDTSIANSGNIVAREWDFGDGSPAVIVTDTTTMHAYTVPGFYTVTLIVTNETGCTAVFSRSSIVLVDGVTPSFEPASMVTACVGSGVILTDTSLANSSIALHEWDFGDGSPTVITTVATVAHSYLNGGYYTVTLRMTNTTGCSDLISRSNAVFIDGTRADFTATPLSTCLNSSVTFTSTSATSSTITGYQWDFGDGSPVVVTTDAITTHTYAAPGYHTIALTITTAGGCQASEIKPNYIFVDGLSPSFEPSAPVTVCSSNATVYVTDTSIASSTIIAYLWDWGDGTISATASITTANHTYSAPGHYTVTLTVTSENGCAMALSRPNLFFVNGLKAIISVPNPGGSQCAPSTVYFESGSVTSDTVNGITGHVWDFGDGTITATGSITNIWHTYTQAGRFTVTLTVTSGNCSDTIVSPNHVFVDSLNPTFVPTQTTAICPGAAVHLTDTSAVTGTILFRNWDFGDGMASGNVSNTIHISHVYTIPGPYTVTLTLYTEGCGFKTAAVPDLVSVENVTAAFTTALASCTSTDVPFTYTGSYVGALSSLVWDWGDGQVLNAGTALTATHQYTSPGIYVVVLTTTTSAGCQDVATGTVTIEGAQAAFDPSTPQRVCLNAPVTLSDTSVVSSSVVSYLWDFGDGVTSTLPLVTHTYSAIGTYTVTLTVESVGGCLATTVRPNWITVESVTAAISPTIPLSVCINQPAMFSDISTVVPTGTIASRLWDFGDGGTSAEANPAYIYTSGGTFTVTLTVTSTGGCTEVATQVVNVQGASVGFDMDTLTCFQAGGLTVNLTNTTTYSGAIGYYEWRFGDGITDTINWATTSHLYSAPGAYTVTLFVSTTAGCAYTFERPLSIDALAVSMTHTPLISTCAGSAVVFSDTSQFTGTLSSRLWEFGDGITATTAGATHVYMSGGTYVITLTLTTESGCSDYTTSTIFVDDITAAFTAVPLAVCLGGSIHFSDTSSASSGITGIEWNLGDGTTSTDPVTDHVYAAAGIYTVWLTATNGSGCQRAISMTVAVESVIAGINPPAGPICQHQPLTFNDASTVTGTISQWQWQFSDGGTATTPNPGYTFHATGLHTVTLTVTTSGGCTDTATVVVNVQAQPTPSIVVSQDPAYVDITTYFTDTGSAPGNTWQWDLGDGYQSGPLSTPSVSHIYSLLSSQTVVVVLTVTAASGCISVTQRTLDVLVPSVSTVTITADPGLINAGGSTVVCVFVTNTAGLPIADGTSVSLYSTPTLGTLVDPGLSTTAGMACTTFVANAGVSGTVTLRAEVDGEFGETQVTIRLGPTGYSVYLPVVLRNYGPDLETVSLQVVFGATAQDPDYALITIRNNGSTSVTDFWVDLYLDPWRTPQVGDIWPDLCQYGKAWYVRDVLVPGQTIVLDTRQADDPASPGTRYSIWPVKLPTGAHNLYALADSYWRPNGMVVETNEGNNLIGPIPFVKAASALSPEPTPVPAPKPLQGQSTPQPPSARPVARPTSPGHSATPTRAPQHTPRP